MASHVAFLRGMNVGGRRLTNDELRAHFEAMGFGGVASFRASGNVVFATSAEEPPGELGARIERGLASALGYEVPTFIRAAQELRAIATMQPFAAEQVAASAGKLQVALLAASPSPRGAQPTSCRWQATRTGSCSASASSTGCRAVGRSSPPLT
jgi:uncharacterized protein (DUF1697 family)